MRPRDPRALASPVKGGKATPEGLKEAMAEQRREIDRKRAALEGNGSPWGQHAPASHLREVIRARDGREGEKSGPTGKDGAPKMSVEYVSKMQDEHQSRMTETLNSANRTIEAKEEEIRRTR